MRMFLLLQQDHLLGPNPKPLGLSCQLSNTFLLEGQNEFMLYDQV